MEETILNDGKKSRFLVESERLRNNLETVRTRAQALRLLIRDIETLLGEIDASQNDSRLLKAQLNQTAVQLGLRPLPMKNRKSRKRRPA